MVIVFADSTFPTLSVAKNVIVVIPSTLTMNDVKLVGSVVLPTGCAPVALYVICFTPGPPGLSKEVRFTVTLELFHPAALGCGNRVAVVVGGMGSGITC